VRGVLAPEKIVAPPLKGQVSVHAGSTGVREANGELDFVGVFDAHIIFAM